jgi:hypothetical protein
VKDQAGDPTKRKVIVAIKDAALTAPAATSDGDPSKNGATLVLFSPTTAQSENFALIAQHWTAVGNPAGSKGYKYSNKDQADGPCTKALLKPGKLLKVLCNGTQITYALNNPAGQGTMALTFQAGTGATSARFCAAFSGTAVTKDTPAINGSGTFQAKGAPPPMVCPQP